MLSKIASPLMVLALSVPLGALAQAQETPGQVYVVKKGDTLNALVKRFYPNSPLRDQLLRDQLRAQNPSAFMKGKPTILLAGASLRVPNHLHLVEQQAAFVAAGGQAGVAGDDPPQKWVRFP
jgi:Tfp pilus assembly protein FimV